MVKKKYDIVIVGGFGHIGLPLGLSFANKGKSVCLYDIDKESYKTINEGKLPFIEYDAGKILKKVLKNGKLETSLDINSVSKAKYVIITIGTPVDEYLNPKTNQFLNFFKNLSKYLNSKQTIIIRSSVFPDTCKRIYDSFKKKKIEFILLS